MKNCYLYSFRKDVKIKDRGLQRQNYLVIFFPYKDVLRNVRDIQVQLREYFFNTILPDKLIVICLEYNKDQVSNLFKIESDIYNYIPRFSSIQEENSVTVISLDKNGEFTASIGTCPEEDELDEVYNRGMVKIFIENGGLIISQSAHHFVFPSGKHSDRFLRPGNVLIHGTEIMFLATAILRHFKVKRTEYIYCDTSSINSLAYSYIILLKELDPSLTKSIHVESFGSYEFFEKAKFEAKKESLFLISSSTSGSILERMTDEKIKENKKRNISLSNIAVIYGLNVESRFSEQVICDLTLNRDFNPEGIESFESYNVNKGKKCKFCEDGSTAMNVKGDVFLLEKPAVTSHLIKITDKPKFLNSFIDFYEKEEENKEPVIKCFYKENGTEGKKYEVYIDIERILKDWDKREKSRFQKIFKKLEKYILQNIPATLKYMIVLPDNASKLLAKVISNVLNEHNVPFEEKNILSINELNKIKKDKPGVIAVVSSSIVTGRNLLYLSRALRDYEDVFQRIFFTYINRTERKDHLDFLESNLGLGEFGIGSHKIINVESIFCTQESINTPWHLELDFIKLLQEYCEEKGGFDKTLSYCSIREKELNESGKYKGLGDNLFFPSLKNLPLKIRKGFAFAPSVPTFIDNATQSEVYFIISNVLNEIRSKGVLNQSEYVRNLLDPGNFVRYNDGVIQASILRSATNDELKYDLSDELSLQMKSILGDMIIHIEDDHAEGLSEFFYAIAIKKLKLSHGVIKDCISLLYAQDKFHMENSILKGIVAYIEDKVIPKEDISLKFKQLTVPKIK